MNTAILWVRGEQHAIDRVLTQTGAIPEKIWKRGDAKIRNAVHEDSGFSVLVADSDSPREMCDKIREMLGRYGKASLHFNGSNFSAELSLGVTVGDSAQFVAVASFNPDDLRILGLPRETLI